ncbi:MAG TPA: hypothetical protein VF779_00065, partial [Pyrinomonadaceae bacterium]
MIVEGRKIICEAMMRGKLINRRRRQACTGQRVFILTLLICFLFIPLYTKAQDIKIISKKPPVMQLYDRTKNETDIKLKLGNNADASNISEVMSGQADVIVPIQSGILLSFADYFYEGRTPSRKGSVKFTFLSEHKSTFKSPPDFSIIADGIEAQKGAAELPGLWSYKENSANVEQQMITL